MRSKAYLSSCENCAPYWSAASLLHVLPTISTHGSVECQLSGQTHLHSSEGYCFSRSPLINIHSVPHTFIVQHFPSCVIWGILPLSTQSHQWERLWNPWRCLVQMWLWCSLVLVCRFLNVHRNEAGSFRHHARENTWPFIQSDEEHPQCLAYMYCTHEMCDFKVLLSCLLRRYIENINTVLLFYKLHQLTRFMSFKINRSF